jgi:hypothetical protein
MDRVYYSLNSWIMEQQWIPATVAQHCVT